MPNGPWFQRTSLLAAALISAAPALNVPTLLIVLVVMRAISDTADGELAGDADAAIRQLYARHAPALRWYAGRFCPDPASAEDIVQETFIWAWRSEQLVPCDSRPPAGHAHYERLACQPDPHHGDAVRHVIQVAQPLPRPAEPSGSPIRLSS
jgi:Sigma-70 region 2